MGTPHRGADIAYWGRILGKLANLPLMGSIRTELLKELQPKSVTLGEICSQFVERGSKLQMYSFYERVKTTGLNDLVSRLTQAHHSSVLTFSFSRSSMINLRSYTFPTRHHSLWKLTIEVYASS